MTTAVPSADGAVLTRSPRHPRRAPHLVAAPSPDAAVATIRAAQPVTAPATPGALSISISVLNTFRVSRGERTLNLPGNSRRLLALLAMRDAPMTRLLVAGTLWPEATEHDAASSLRSALWRLKGAVGDAVAASDLDLGLRDDVRVDVRDARASARRVLDPSGPIAPDDETAGAIAALSGDLLPGWYDDWTIAEGAQWHQLRLHALEALAERLLQRGEHALAVTAALAAVNAEPLRESAHSALIAGLLAEGNQKEALDHYHAYRALLDDELGIEPSDRFTGLVTGLRRSA